MNDVAKWAQTILNDQENMISTPKVQPKKQDIINSLALVESESEEEEKKAAPLSTLN